MNFVYPWFIAASVAVAIPIIIHLFNFRRFKTVYFSDVRFLQQVKIEKQSKNRLKHLLILACRILAIMCLVLAFSLPFLSNDAVSTSNGRKAVSVFLDNSFSMEQVNENGTLLQEAIQRASVLASNYGPADRFQLLNHALDPSAQHLLNRADFTNAITTQQITPESQGLADILLKQQQALQANGGTEQTIVVISDFQSGMLREPLPAINQTKVLLVPLRANQAENLFVDSCWLNTPVVKPNEEVELSIRIVNSGEENRESVPVKLLVNGVQKAVAETNILSKNDNVLTLKFRTGNAGYYSATIQLTDFPIVYDDEFHFSFKVADQLKVLCVYEGKEPGYFRGVFGNDSAFSYDATPIKTLKPSALSSSDFHIFYACSQWSSGLIAEIKKSLTDGKSILMVPPFLQDMASTNSVLTELGLPTITGIDSVATKVNRVEEKSDLYKNVFGKNDGMVDYPLLQKQFLLSSGSPYQTYISTLSGRTLLCKSLQSNAWLLSSGLSEDWGNFARHALFVPTLFNMALLSSGSQQLYAVINENNTFSFPYSLENRDTPLRVIGHQTDFLPSVQYGYGKVEVSLFGQLKKAGTCFAVIDKDTLGSISLNYNRDESELTFYDDDAILEAFKKTGTTQVEIIPEKMAAFSATLAEMQEGKGLWRVFLIMAIVFSITEILLLTLWRT